MKSPFLYMLPVLLLLLAACEASEPAADEQTSTQPEPIAYGEEQDPYCETTITEERYGAVLTTDDGTRYTFASVECMIGFELAGHVAPDEIAERWVVDVVRHKRFLPATEARYLHTENQPSPGGLHLTPFDGDEDLSYNMRFLLHGDDLAWDEAVEVVHAEWFKQAQEVH